MDLARISGSGVNNVSASPGSRAGHCHAPRRVRIACQNTPHEGCGVTQSSRRHCRCLVVTFWRVGWGRYRHEYRDGNDVSCRGSRRKSAEADKPDIGQASPLIVDIYLRNMGVSVHDHGPTALGRPLRSRCAGQDRWDDPSGNRGGAAPPGGRSPGRCSVTCRSQGSVRQGRVVRAPLTARALAWYRARRA
jgi:hypothetical protein